MNLINNLIDLTWSILSIYGDNLSSDGDILYSIDCSKGNLSLFRDHFDGYTDVTLRTKDGVYNITTFDRFVDMESISRIIDALIVTV